ncbi:hypothetical protein ACWDA7_48185, partial [Streptomyces sp. NPDC001156]
MTADAEPDTLLSRTLLLTMAWPRACATPAGSFQGMTVPPYASPGRARGHRHALLMSAPGGLATPQHQV